MGGSSLEIRFFLCMAMFLESLKIGGFSYYFFLRESIKCIFSSKIPINPIWNLANVIHQRNLQRRIWNFIKKMGARYKWYYMKKNKMVQKKISSVLTLCVVMFSRFSFAFDCSSIILYILVVILHFI